MAAAAVASSSRGQHAAPARPARRQPNLDIIIVSLHANKEVVLMKVGRKECFVFNFGCLVCWSCKAEVAEAAKEALQPHLVEPLDTQNIDADFVDIQGGLDLGLSSREPQTFERVALAYALAQSVRLGSLELRIDRWIAQTRGLPEQLATNGRTSLTGKGITKLIGQLICLKHEVNLETDILDTPEFFWEYGDFEPLYQSSRAHLDVDQRVSVVNQRFEVLQDLFDVLEAELNERNANRLEWIVIVLLAGSIVVMALRFYSHFVGPSPHALTGQKNTTTASNVSLCTTPLLSLAGLCHRWFFKPLLHMLWQHA